MQSPATVLDKQMRRENRAEAGIGSLGFKEKGYVKTIILNILPIEFPLFRVTSSFMLPRAYLVNNVYRACYACICMSYLVLEFN
jgi:hypothetical protein